MSIQGRLPGVFKTLHIQAIHIHPQLVDVVTRLLLIERVEEHPLLHRRERIDIRNLRGRHRQAVQLTLCKAGEREVRWRNATALLQATMGNDLDQGLLVACCQFLDS
ncbi:hypothetical protein D3C76_1614030 [compost metagenome]